jgi:hypothetical protein
MPGFPLIILKYGSLSFPLFSRSRLFASSEVGCGFFLSSQRWSSPLKVKAHVIVPYLVPFQQEEIAYAGSFNPESL